MSIIYPETHAAAPLNTGAGVGIMNAGSALFPTGSTRVYERRAKGQAGKNNLMLWIAAPVGVSLIAGAAFLSLGQHTAAPAHSATRTTVTRTVSSPISAPSKIAPREGAAAPAKAIVAPAETARVVHEQSVRERAPAASPAGPVTHRTSTVSTRSVQSTAPTAVSAPLVANPPAPAPAAATPAPTMGAFALTPAPTAPDAAPVVQAPAVQAPAAQAPAAQAPAPDAASVSPQG